MDDTLVWDGGDGGDDGDVEMWRWCVCRIWVYRFFSQPFTLPVLLNPHHAANKLEVNFKIFFVFSSPQQHPSLSSFSCLSLSLQRHKNSQDIQTGTHNPVCKHTYPHTHTHSQHRQNTYNTHTAVMLTQANIYTSQSDIVKPPLCGSTRPFKNQQATFICSHSYFLCRWLSVCL